jgi:hypothetical protein
VGNLTEASFQAASGRRYGCKVGDILQKLDEDDRATLLRVLADTRISDHGIAKVLTEQGHSVAGNTVWKHRIGGCKCQG